VHFRHEVADIRVGQHLTPSSSCKHTNIRMGSGIFRLLAVWQAQELEQQGARVSERSADRGVYMHVDVGGEDLQTGTAACRYANLDTPSLHLFAN
jgi:hypothetical protein